MKTKWIRGLRWLVVPLVLVALMSVSAFAAEGDPSLSLNASVAEGAEVDGDGALAVTYTAEWTVAEDSTVDAVGLLYHLSESQDESAPETMVATTTEAENTTLNTTPYTVIEKKTGEARVSKGETASSDTFNQVVTDPLALSDKLNLTFTATVGESAEKTIKDQFITVRAYIVVTKEATQKIYYTGVLSGKYDSSGEYAKGFGAAAAITLGDNPTGIELSSGD